MNTPTVVRKQVFNEHGVLTGYVVDTYSPRRSTPTPAPSGQVVRLADVERLVALGIQRALGGIAAPLTIHDDDLPDDGPAGWDDASARPLASHDDANEWDGPSDSPSGW